MTDEPSQRLRPVPTPIESPSQLLEGLEGRRTAGRKSRLVPGEVIPRTNYRLLKWLGEGGMGTIYLAENVEIERKVAIKSLHPHLVRKPKVAETFRREARASARIGAPNIIDVIDFLSLEDGRLLFVMEYLDGHALVRDVDNAPMPIERLIPILRQVCKGLHAAHRAGIIHRDIKPENVMLMTRDRRPDFVKVVDFGIASLQSEADANHRRAGTPNYIAPEQIQRRAFDGRVDMYSLACTAYEMLTGRTPFESDSIRELLESHLHAEPLLPSGLVGSEAVPPAFEAVLMRCLAKEPEDRYVDMADLEAALCEAQISDGVVTLWDDLPIPDDIEGERRAKILAEMPQDPVKRRPAWLLPTIIAGALLTGGLVTYAFVGGTDPAALQAASRVDELTNAARAAGAKAQWVYPPIDQPQARTALDYVKKLEKTDDAAKDDANVRALELRKEFATALARQGDRYLDRPGGRPFAYDFYHQAMLFDPLNKRVHEVGGFSGPIGAMLLADAERGEFSVDQLQRGEITRALAIEDPELRKSALIQAQDRIRGKTVSLETSSAVSRVLEDIGVPDTMGQASGASGKPTAADEEPVLDNPADSGDAADEEPAAEPTVASKAADPKPSDAKNPGRDRARGKQLADDGKRAQKSGDAKSAERLYHKALAADRYNSTALSGLGDIYFDQGNYSQSVTYRQRAVRVSQNSAARHLALGDAYFKVLRYQEALAAYEKAQRLGSSSAKARIAKVESRL